MPIEQLARKLPELLVDRDSLWHAFGQGAEIGDIDLAQTELFKNFRVGGRVFDFDIHAQRPLQG